MERPALIKESQGHQLLLYKRHQLAVWPSGSHLTSQTLISVVISAVLQAMLQVVCDIIVKISLSIGIDSAIYFLEKNAPEIECIHCLSYWSDFQKSLFVLISNAILCKSWNPSPILTTSKGLNINCCLHILIISCYYMCS